jgi:pseudouridine synthase
MRPTVFSLLKGKELHLLAVGRLDWATTGLLILTNSSRLASWLTEPSNQIERTYLVSVRGEVTTDELHRLRSGLMDDGDLLKAEEVLIRKASQKESHLTVRLTEGKNREIRRMFLALGHEVTRLKRVAYGPLELGDLEPGEYRELTIDELKRAFPSAPL